MRTLTSFLAVLLVSGSVIAGSVDVVPFDSTASASFVTTNVSGVKDAVTLPLIYDGFVQMVDIVSGLGAGQTCAVVIATAPALTGQIPQIIYSNLALSGSAQYMPTNVVGNPSIFLAKDTLKMYTWKSSSTNGATVKALVKKWQ